MAGARLALVIALACAPGCGDRAAKPAPHGKKDAGAIDAAAQVEIEPRPLGLADRAAYEWRKRGGQRAFRTARKAEARDDWAEVVTRCQEALAADPGHLEASWLLAVGLAKLGKLDQVHEPLARAVAGDFAKWGHASLENPGLAPFLAIPIGEAWRRRVELDRARYAAAVLRSVIVNADGVLYAVEVETGRWYRLTRSPGVVIGALAIPSAHKIAYVSRRSRPDGHELGIGVIDLAAGKSSGAVPLGTPGPLTVAYSARPPVGVWVGSGAPRAAVWRHLDDEYRLHALPPRTARPAGPWLEITAKGGVERHALPANVVADWDDQALASAIRIGTSNRVVSVPSPGMIDGDTAAWSPDRMHFAFVAQLDDHCTAGAINTAAFVADASTGGTRELARAAGGIALEWLAERKVVIASDHGVAIYGVDGDTAPIAIEGATGLLVPRERPRCAPEASPPEASDELDGVEPAGSEDYTEPVGQVRAAGAAGAVRSDEPLDAGVLDAR